MLFEPKLTWVGFDKLFDVGVDKTRGRPKRGNATRYFVWEVVRKWNDHAKQCYWSRNKICEFRAYDDEEALLIAENHNKVKQYYKRRFEQEFNFAVGMG